MEYKIIKSRFAHCIFSLAAAVLCASGIIDGYDGTPTFLMYFTYLSNILILGRCEGMVHCYIAVFFFIILKKREVSNPKKIEHSFGDKVKSLCDFAAERTE